MVYSKLGTSKEVLYFWKPIPWEIPLNHKDVTKVMIRIYPVLFFFMVVFLLAVFLGCSPDQGLQDSPLLAPFLTAVEPTDPIGTVPEMIKEDQDILPTVSLSVGDKNFTVILHDNELAQVIIEEMPFTLIMDDYAAKEKTAELTFFLPSSDTTSPARINKGELYVWSEKSLVIFYTSFLNSYAYVPMGYIEDVKVLEEALGNGSVEVTFRVNE